MRETYSQCNICNIVLQTMFSLSSKLAFCAIKTNTEAHVCATRNRVSADGLISQRRIIQLCVLLGAVTGVACCSSAVLGAVTGVVACCSSAVLGNTKIKRWTKAKY